MRRNRAAGASMLIVLAVSLLSIAVPGGAQEVDGSRELAYFPGAEVSLPKSEVFDSFFGYFLGLVNVDAVGKIDKPRLHEVLPVFNRFFSLPVEQFRLMTRVRRGGNTEVGLFFQDGIDLPIPYRILWDTPGTISASAVIRLREVRLSRVEAPSPGGVIILSPAYAYITEEGHASLDFDPWIDVLLGRAVDDVTILLTVLFRTGGTWYVGLMGRGYQGQAVVGYFDFKANRIVVPVPRRLRRLGPYLMDLLLGERGSRPR